MSKVHEFHDRNQYSLAGRDEKFWDLVYHKAFPTMIRWELVDDISQQKQGIDRKLFLQSAGGSIHEILIDEKKRGEVFPDILLEFASAAEFNTPGWIEKDLRIDFLAYAFMPTSTVYLFPWPMLKRAWVRFGEKWKKEYRIISANNPGYTTLSVAVPIKKLQSAVTSASVINVSKQMGRG